MRRLLLLAMTITALVLTMVPAGIASGANADAAHACAQGGYLTLQRSGGGGFKNPGECMSYAARDGDIVGVGPACATTATSGCIVLENVVMKKETLVGGSPVYDVPEVSYTVSGTMIFSPICQNATTGCDYSSPPPTVTGSGTFSTSSGVSGTWTSAWQYPDPYSFSNGPASSCPAATIRSVTAHVSLTATSPTPGVTGGGFIQVRTDATMTGPTKNFVYGNFSTGSFPTGEFLSDLTGAALTC
jgi:hypothetical protein